MDGVILYQSKYGSTKKYAMWLSEKTGFLVMETKKAKIEKVSKFDTVILGGGVYASGIAGLSFLRKNIDVLKNKRLIVFCVGASPYDESSFQEVIDRNMKDKLKGIPCFYCRGGWDINSMTITDRVLCKALQKSIAKKRPDELKGYEKALIDAKDDSCDWTDAEYLAPILDMLKCGGSGEKQIASK